MQALIWVLVCNWFLCSVYVKFLKKESGRFAVEVCASFAVAKSLRYEYVWVWVIVFAHISSHQGLPPDETMLQKVQVELRWNFISRIYKLVPKHWLKPKIDKMRQQDESLIRIEPSA